jgi:hypothetical protein
VDFDGRISDPLLLRLGLEKVAAWKEWCNTAANQRKGEWSEGAGPGARVIEPDCLRVVPQAMVCQSDGWRIDQSVSDIFGKDFEPLPVKRGYLRIVFPLSLRHLWYNLAYAKAIEIFANHNCDFPFTTFQWAFFVLKKKAGFCPLNSSF